MGIFDRLRQAVKSEDGGPPAVRPDRNEPCWCGSGRKYKKCHLPEEERAAAERACSLRCGPT